MRTDHRRRRWRSWLNVGERTEQVVSYLRAGHTPGRIAQRLGVSRNWVYVIRQRVAENFWPDLEYWMSR